MASKRRQDITAILYDKKGRVLSVGKNSYTKTHPLQAHWAKKVGLEHKTYLHAEVDSIIKCKDLTKVHKMSISRVDGYGNYMLAKPCKICQALIDDLDISNVEYTTGE